MQDFKKLSVWQRAYQLTLATYRATAPFPWHEMLGLTRQMRQAASSIAGNIAEGCCRHTKRDFAHFLDIAAGSAGELENHFLVARELGWLAPGDQMKLNTEVTSIRRMLVALATRVRREP